MNEMIKQTLTLFLLFMVITADISAQKSFVCSVAWKVGGLLPANEQKQSLGFAGPVTGIHQDVLIVAGGANFPDGMPWLGGKKKYYDDGYIFKKKESGQIEYYKSFKLPFSLAYSANCSVSSGIITVGGENEMGLSDKVLLLRWDKTKQTVRIKRLPNLPFTVTNAAVTAISNKIYVAGGETKNEVSNHFLVLDLNEANTGWKQLPSLPKPVSHGVMAAQSNGVDQSIYIIGGRKKNSNDTSTLYASTLQFDWKANQWAEKKPVPYALSAGTGVAAGSNQILLFGGDKGETFHQTEELIAAINNETDSVKKQRLNQQKIGVQSAHPGFDRHVLLYDTVKDKWTTVGTIPFDVPATTTATKWGKDVIIPSGEIKAGVRTPQILLGRLSYQKTSCSNQ